MKETDIRPEKYQEKQSVLAKVDAGRMLSRYEDYVDVDCPACGSGKQCYVFSKYGLNYNNCSSCETIYISPRPSVEVLDYFYKGSVNYEFWNDYIFPNSENYRKEHIFKPRAKIILDIMNKNNPKADSIIEVGAAQGFFLDEILKIKKFKKVTAIEPTKGLAKSLSGKGIDVIENLIENVDISYYNKYDLLVNFEVIEHLFSPFDFLTKCNDLLKDKGILFLTCPNGKGFDNIILDQESPTFDYEHLNYFNPSSIKILLSNTGFEVINISTPGKLDIDLVKQAYNDGRVDLSDNIFIRNIIEKKNASLNDNFQTFISDNCLSGHLQVIAQKIHVG